MATLKRRFVNALGRFFDLTVVRHGNVAPLLEQEHLKRFLSEFEIDCVFDVGANSGQYAEMLREIGYRGAIVSFEPIPSLAADMRKKAQRDGKWFIEECALDDAERIVPFKIMNSSQFSSLKDPSHQETALFIDQNAVAETIDLQTVRLERWYAVYRDRIRFNRAFLKMDTQGNDIAVARSAGSYLSKFVGLQSELAIKKIYASSENYRTALDFYTDAGFELSALVPNNYGHFPVLVEIDCIMYNKRFSRTSLRHRLSTRDA